MHRHIIRRTIGIAALASSLAALPVAAQQAAPVAGGEQAAPDYERIGRFIYAYYRAGGAAVERLSAQDNAAHVAPALAQRARKLADEVQFILQNDAQVPDARLEAAVREAAAVDAGIKDQALPDTAGDRLPMATDIGVAWDQIAHRGNIRWDCRAVPSGKFVMNSLCADMPKVDTRWPGTRPPPGWDGMVHLD